MYNNFIGENEFLLKYNKREDYSSDNFKNTKLAWKDLIEIVNHYNSIKEQLEEDRIAFIAKIQNFKEVHSIRSRLKNDEHLIEKIIRKIAKNGLRIDVNNYLSNVTDIIGVRIIHISRFDSELIFDHIHNIFANDFYENVAIKIRKGDDTSQYASLIAKGAELQEQSKYRSIHYTIKNNSQALIELQTRTLFEEGWSEIDHDALYKATQKDRTIELSSSILSRLAGTCDDIAALMLKPYKDDIRTCCEDDVVDSNIRDDLLLNFIKKY